MASLYRKPVVVTDPVTGERVKTKSKKWWGRFRDENGFEKRVPLAVDKKAAQTLLNQFVKKTEFKVAGLVDPFESQRKRPLSAHLDDFEQYLKHKANCAQHVKGLVKRIRKIMQGCKWTYINDMSPSDVERYLSSLRTGKPFLSIQTSNHYLRGIKQFSRWLVRDRRNNDDRLQHLSMLNARTDRRWERRALTTAELTLLVAAAEVGRRIQSIHGPDRAMMYLLACWTGYRKTEIGSLTRESLRLDANPPTATVEAGYSKRRREDTQILHLELAARLRAWLATKPKLQPKQLLFPVSDKVPGGTDRRTAMMMRLDLEAARRKWISEARTKEEKRSREESDFLKYEDSCGRHADFHSNRHTFITNLSRAGVSPRMVQALARHSDIRLTMGIYTHVGVEDQVAAIDALPAPPRAYTSVSDESLAPMANTRTKRAVVYGDVNNCRNS